MRLIKKLDIINIFAYTVKYPQTTVLSQEVRAQLLRGSLKTIDGSADHHNRVGELRCMRQVTASVAPDEQRCTRQATRIASEPIWVSSNFLGVIEEVRYHELFIQSFEE